MTYREAFTKIEGALSAEQRAVLDIELDMLADLASDADADADDDDDEEGYEDDDGTEVPQPRPADASLVAETILQLPPAEREAVLNVLRNL